MSWPEVINAKKEKRHEIVLSGNEVSERLKKDGLDTTIFDLLNLNYLKFNQTILTEIPDAIQKLVNLQTLVLYSNKLNKISDKISHLQKLKVLDLSHNSLKTVPMEISQLLQLVTLNVSNNDLEEFPTLSQTSKLTTFDVSNNKLKVFPDICYPELSNLFELRVNGNSIENIPHDIKYLVNLKVFCANSNSIQIVPGELGDCNKLKELNLKENPITDKRLLKLIVQCYPKQVLDYVNKHCPRTTSSDVTKTKKGLLTSDDKNKEDLIEKNNKETKYKIIVSRSNPESVKIIVKEAVKSIRKYIVACLVLNLDFTEESFKKFIQLQTKLHETICNKRNAATIATHDGQKLGEGDLTYTAIDPNELSIQPLNRSQIMTGAELLTKLQVEAEILRKEKKRSTYSGIHKYLYLIEGKPKYPCLLNAKEEVISFPPITNSDRTKISLDTKSLMIEVTSDTSQLICKKVLDLLLKEMVLLFGKPLTVQQIKNVDNEGVMQFVYPSSVDLNFEEDSDITVIR